MSARECPACRGRGGEYVYMRDYGYEGESQWSACDTCDGSGRVHPSVEVEIVVELHGRDIILPLGAGDGIEAESIYKVIVQKVGEKP